MHCTDRSAEVYRKSDNMGDPSRGKRNGEEKVTQMGRERKHQLRRRRRK